MRPEARLEALRARVPARLPRLVLVVSPGRSGTAALAWHLGEFRGVAARHEPRPSFAEALRACTLEPTAAAEFWACRKLPRIARERRAVYAETSHLACLGFLEGLEDLGVPFELVLLARPARAVATSLWRLDTIPGRTLRGLRYYLSPSDPVLLPLEPTAVRALGDYQLCYWYAREVEARAEAWRARALEGGPPVHAVTTDELGDRAAVHRLGAALRLGPRRPLADLLFERGSRRHRNDRRANKLERSLPPGELERQEAEVDRLLAPLRAALDRRVPRPAAAPLRPTPTP